MQKNVGIQLNIGNATGRNILASILKRNNWEQLGIDLEKNYKFSR